MIASSLVPAQGYTDFRVGVPIRVREAARLLARQNLGAVLDIGCADAGFLGQLPSDTRKVGTDLAPNRFRAPGTHFVRSDATAAHLPFADETFDAVYAGEIIEHVLDTERFVAEIRRILRPGGRLILTTPNLCSLKNLAQWLRGQQLAWVDYKNGQLGHVRYFSPATLRAVLEDAHFVVERLGSSGFEVGAHVRWLSWLTPVTGWLFARSIRGNCLIVAAIKAERR